MTAIFARQHVHVYRVTGLIEYDFDNVSPTEARVMAIDAARAAPDFGTPDCKLIALGQDVPGQTFVVTTFANAPTKTIAGLVQRLEDLSIGGLDADYVLKEVGAIAADLRVTLTHRPLRQEEPA